MDGLGRRVFLKWPRYSGKLSPWPFTARAAVASPCRNDRFAVSMSCGANLLEVARELSDPDIGPEDDEVLLLPGSGRGIPFFLDDTFTDSIGSGRCLRLGRFSISLPTVSPDSSPPFSFTFLSFCEPLDDMEAVSIGCGKTRRVVCVDELEETEDEGGRLLDFVVSIGSGRNFLLPDDSSGFLFLTLLEDVSVG